MLSLSICYGKVARKDDGIKLQLCGQDFWELISGEAEFYKELMEPVGKVAQKHGEAYKDEKAKLINKVTKTILDNFSVDGSLD